MKKLVFTMIFLLIAMTGSLMAQGQVSKVSLQASGLTCSMCSNAINKALKKLDFVLDVDADIKTYSFEITFKPKSIVDFDLIRKKVEGAGFAVSAFYANISFNDTPVQVGERVPLQDKTFLFVDTKSQVISGIKRVKILDRGFVSANEFKLNNYLSPFPQTYHVTLLEN